MGGLGRKNEKVGQGLGIKKVGLEWPQEGIGGLGITPGNYQKVSQPGVEPPAGGLRVGFFFLTQKRRKKLSPKTDSIESGLNGTSRSRHIYGDRVENRKKSKTTKSMLLARGSQGKGLTILCWTRPSGRLLVWVGEWIFNPLAFCLTPTGLETRPGGPWARSKPRLL